MKNELHSTDSRTLRNMADELKADAIALQHSNRAEALTLLRLFREIVTELHRRKNPALNHLWN